MSLRVSKCQFSRDFIELPSRTNEARIQSYRPRWGSRRFWVRALNCSLSVHFLYCLVVDILVKMCLFAYFAHIFSHSSKNPVPFAVKTVHSVYLYLIPSLQLWYLWYLWYLYLGITTFPCTSCTCMWLLNFLNHESWILYYIKKTCFI